MDLVGADGENDPDLVAATEPRVRRAYVALCQGLDVFSAAFGGDIDDATADRVVARRVGLGQTLTATRGSRSTFLTFWKPWTVLTDDVLAIGVDPRLRYLGRAIGHQGRDEAEAGLVQESDEALGQVHA